MQSFGLFGLGAGALLAVVLAQPAVAQGAAGRNSSSVVNSLRAEGISASSVQWSDIENQCLPIKSNDAEDYQQCRLDKARLQAAYKEDSITCQDTVQAFNPNTLRYRAVLVDGPQDGIGEATVTLLNTAPAVADANAFRRHIFNQCMHGQGWRNPRDYRRGRAD